MSEKLLQIAPNFTIPAEDYASQGNAILGIRDSGKTYDATKIAEQLLENGIPIVAIDPVGVWRFLKVGKGDHPGYPIIVAGGQDPDIELIPKNDEKGFTLLRQRVRDIMEVSINENIPLVIDLYAMDISKNQWKIVVEEAVRYLMYNNKGKGLRHVFIEEATEFAPQMIPPGQGVLFNEVEKLARMGRNASLGVTFITQRAEQLNKSVLELCALTFLHKQNGKNSLKSIAEWFKISGIEEAKDVTEKLPTLSQGECFVVGALGQPNPQLIKVNEKVTVHPNPKQPELYSKSIPRDVSSIVEKLNKSLEVKEDKTEKKIPAVTIPSSNKDSLTKENIALNKRIQELEIENKELKTDSETLVNQIGILKAQMFFVQNLYRPEYRVMKALMEMDLSQFPGDLPEVSEDIEHVKYIGVTGDVSGMDEDTIMAKVDEKLRAITKNMAYGQPVEQINPVAALKSKFLQEARDLYIEKISKLSDNAKKMLKFLIAQNKGLKISPIIQNCFNQVAGGDNLNKYKSVAEELISVGLVRKDKNAVYYENIQEGIKKEIGIHSDKEEDIISVYNHIVTNLLN